MSEASGTAYATGQGRGRKPRLRGTGVLWRSWLWVSWFLVPALFLFRGMCGVGGWESLFLVLVSPVLVPALGLLGALPRFVLRHRGHTSIPALVGVPMVVCAWGLALLMFSMRGATDGPSVDSVLRQLFPAVSQRAELLTLGIAAWMIPIAYLAALVLACVLRPSRRPVLADLSAAVALLAVPLLLWPIVAAVDTAAMRGERDFSGAQESDVAELTLADQRERQERQWDETQEELVPLRAAIAPDGWLATGGGVDSERDGIEPLSYDLFAHWERGLDGSPEEVAAQMLDLAADEGWRLEEGDSHAYTARPDEPGLVVEDENGVLESVRYNFSNGSGYALTLWVDTPEEPEGLGTDGDETEDDGSEGADSEAPDDTASRTSILRLSIESGPYWQSRGEQYDWSRSGSDAELRELRAELPGTFSSDEWPGLLVTENRPPTP